MARVGFATVQDIYLLHIYHYQHARRTIPATLYDFVLSMTPRIWAKLPRSGPVTIWKTQVVKYILCLEINHDTCNTLPLDASTNGYAIKPAAHLQLTTIDRGMESYMNILAWRSPTKAQLVRCRLAVDGTCTSCKTYEEIFDNVMSTCPK